MEFEEERNELEIMQDKINQLEKDLSYYKEYRMLDKETLKWLAMNIDPDKTSNEEEIKDMLRNQVAVSYLLIWPILEQRHFSGFMKVGQIRDASFQLYRYYSELSPDLDYIVEHFFHRYNISKNENNPCLKRLQPEHEINDYYKNLLRKKSYNEVLPREKISLLLFVIYRYRNNIFHGSKSIDKWINYSEQINYCLIGMMKIADCMKRHNIVITNPI